MRLSVQQTLKALSDDTRRNILTLLKDGALSAGDIAERFDTTAATISHHLSILKDAGLVRSRRDGKNIYYDLNLSVMEDLLMWIGTLKEKK
jgi:DNA-binding transcriptional ArsR family regulator